MRRSSASSLAKGDTFQESWSFLKSAIDNVECQFQQSFAPDSSYIEEDGMQSTSTRWGYGRQSFDSLKTVGPTVGARGGSQSLESLRGSSIGPSQPATTRNQLSRILLSA